MHDERSVAQRRQDFDWGCVVGAVDTDPADFASESPILGLPMSQTFLYGSVRDGDGTIWTPMRRFAAGDGGTERLLLQTDLGSDAMHVYRTGPRPASGRGVRRGLDGDGPWPERIELTAAGGEWEFLPAATGRMVDLMPIPNPQIEGRWRRVGDTREPTHWFAWGEVAPGHGTTPIRDRRAAG